MARMLQSLIARADGLWLFPTQGNATRFAAEAKEKIKYLPVEEDQLAEGIVVVEVLSGKKLTFPEMWLNWVFNGMHNSIGFWILRCGFQIPDSNR